MKRAVYLFFAAFLAVLAAHAQPYQNLTLGENQHLLGHSTDDKNYYETRSGNYGEVTMATRIDPAWYAGLKNCRAIGIRFALPEAVDVKAVTLHTNSKTVKYKQTPARVSKGWNYVAFDTPQTLTTAGAYVSYTYIQTEMNRGICHWDEKSPGGYWMCYNGQWNDWSEFYGALCIQLVVEADPLPDYGLTAESIDNVPVIMNEEGSLNVRFASNSKKAISHFDYTLSLGDEQTEGTVQLPTPLPAGINQHANTTIKVPAMASSGKYDARLTLTAVNGEALEAAPSVDFKLDVLSRRAPRRTVVEENTGTRCGNCPRAWVGMEYLKEHHADNCIGIAIHQYNADDPMYCTRYASLGFGGAAPLCQVDRKVMTDPYYGTEKLGIDSDVKRYSSIAPTVDVKVEGMFTADMKKVTCKAEVEWLIDTGKYTIAYALTADGLQSSEAAWLQKNDYQIANASTQNILPHMQEYTQFFKGEKNGKSMVELVYNDVLVGSSYSTTGSNGAKALGGSTHTAGEVVNHSYTCQYAVGDACKQVLDYDNIYVTALVIDNNGKIANAARAKVVPIPDGIDGALAPAVPADDSAYDLSGRRLAAPARGFSIVGGRKVLR